MEKAVLNVKQLNVTQGMNGGFSHNGELAIDIGGACEYFKAPFTGIIKRIYTNTNTVWLESVDKVKYADGTEDYMTIATTHDNSVSSLWVGKKIKQGETYYQPGVKGKATGPHIHLGVGKGKFTGNGWYKGDYQPQIGGYAWPINNQYDITKALFVHTEVKQTNPMYDWKETDDYTYNKPILKSVDEIAKEVIAGKWGNGEERKTRLRSAGYSYTTIQTRVNELMAGNKKDTSVTYVVKQGDNLSKIAKKYNTTWQKIYEDNKSVIGSNPNIIKPEQKLVIK